MGQRVGQQHPWSPSGVAGGHLPVGLVRVVGSAIPFQQGVQPPHGGSGFPGA